MRRIAATLLLSPSAALACTMLVTRPNLGLPGEPAGPDAVFTSANPDSVLLGPGDIEIAVTRAPHTVEGRVGEVLTPVEPLAPGDYRVEPCDAGAACTATIAEGAGDPGEPPAPPELTFDPARLGTGQWANCGPVLPATEITTESDAVVVIFAAEPFDTLADAELLAFVRRTDEPRWITHHEGDIYAAAVDAEGEISAWTGPHALSPGCSTTGRGPVGLAVGIAVAALVRRTRA